VQADRLQNIKPIDVANNGWTLRGHCKNENNSFCYLNSPGFDKLILHLRFSGRSANHTIDSSTLRSGPKYGVKKGKTSVWSREEAKTLLDSIPKDSVSGLRDLALITAMFYSFARVSAVLKLKVSQCRTPVAERLHEKGGQEHDMPVHHLVERILDEYIVVANSEWGKDHPKILNLSSILTGPVTKQALFH
jgi:site-specific recombinase XerD